MQIPRHWRLNSQRYALQGVTCPSCSTNIFPPRAVCPYCEAKTEHPYSFDEQDQQVASPERVTLEHAAR